MPWKVSLVRLLDREVNSSYLIPNSFTDDIILKVSPLQLQNSGRLLKIGYFVVSGHSASLDFPVRTESQNIYAFAGINIASSKRYNYFDVELFFNDIYREILIETWEWLPLESMASQEIEIAGEVELLPERSQRTNWYIENRGNNPIAFRWGIDGNQWTLHPDEFISGEKGKNRPLFASGTGIIKFIESWEE